MEDVDIFLALSDVVCVDEDYLKYHKGDKIQILSKQNKHLWRGRNLTTKKDGLIVPSDKIEEYDGRKACM